MISATKISSGFPSSSVVSGAVSSFLPQYGQKVMLNIVQPNPCEISLFSFQAIPFQDMNVDSIVATVPQSVQLKL
jgi:hypothetical protein